ncbi:hypothetical protein NL676_026861 [Syzygium grande]|nr:hypothetical protein NL676_026861 [Syzygium grande]
MKYEPQQSGSNTGVNIVNSPDRISDDLFGSQARLTVVIVLKWLGRIMPHRADSIEAAVVPTGPRHQPRREVPSELRGMREPRAEGEFLLLGVSAFGLVRAM